MIRSISCTLGAAFLLSACATQAPPPVATADGISIQSGQFEFALASGDYRCERGVRLGMQREMRVMARLRHHHGLRHRVGHAVALG